MVTFFCVVVAFFTIISVGEMWLMRGAADENDYIDAVLAELGSEEN